jgi:hypothetical protein
MGVLTLINPIANARNAKYNLESVFELAERELGLVALLDAEGT